MDCLSRYVVFEESLDYFVGAVLRPSKHKGCLDFGIFEHLKEECMFVSLSLIHI